MSLRDELIANASGGNLEGPIEVPEWHRKVYIRSISAREQLRITDSTDDAKEIALRTLLVSIVDENGERELEDGDLDLLFDQPLSIVMPLLLKAAKKNGLTENEVQEAVETFTTAQS